jgi:thiol-disulfide isomerase/thioredoxin
MKNRYPILAVALLITMLLCSTLAKTQVADKTVKLPPFRMMQVNGEVFKAEYLPIGKPILLIYFSPDCDHCEKLMTDFVKHAEAFKKASVVMITYLPVERVAQFKKDYSINRFSNIVVGTEGMTFFVRNYYNLVEMPFAALHDKNGNLIRSYERDVPLQDLSNLLNRLK